MANRGHTFDPTIDEVAVVSPTDMVSTDPAQFINAIVGLLAAGSIPPTAITGGVNDTTLTVTQQANGTLVFTNPDGSAGPVLNSALVAQLLMSTIPAIGGQVTAAGVYFKIVNGVLRTVTEAQLAASLSPLSLPANCTSLDYNNTLDFVVTNSTNNVADVPMPGNAGQRYLITSTDENAPANQKYGATFIGGQNITLPPNRSAHFNAVACA